MSEGSEERGRRGWAILRYGLAAVLVASAHAGAFAWLATHDLSAETPDSVLGAPIDLELIADAPPQPPQDSAPPAPAPSAEPAASSSPPPSPEAPPSPAPQPTEEPPAQTPEPAPSPSPTVTPPPDAVVAPAPPKPPPVKPQKPPPPKPDPERRERAASEAKRQERAANTARASAENRQGAAQRRASSGSDVATWRGEVVAHIAEYKPAGNGAAGTALVAFTVDGSGRVVSASLVRSCGDAALDAASVAMVRRASPVPAPPAELGGHIQLIVPVRFD